MNIYSYYRHIATKKTVANPMFTTAKLYYS